MHILQYLECFSLPFIENMSLKNKTVKYIFFAIVNYIKANSLKKLMICAVIKSLFRKCIILS